MLPSRHKPHRAPQPPFSGNLRCALVDYGGSSARNMAGGVDQEDNDRRGLRRLFPSLAQRAEPNNGRSEE
jgi:hypothetical protein